MPVAAAGRGNRRAVAGLPRCGVGAPARSRSVAHPDGVGLCVVGYGPRGGPAGNRRRRDLMAATVLLVEDERQLRELVRSYLERAGFMVLSTGSGAEAISMFGSSAPDLVVLDLGLPDVPGETVASEVR